MLDLPVETFQKPQTEIEQIVTDASKMRGFFDFAFSATPIDTSDPLYLEAKAIVDAMDNSFTWKELTNIIKESFYVVQKHQNLSIQEQKQSVIKIIDYITDLTDTPYLPDEWIDPLFKMLIPSVVELMSKALNNNLIPVLSDVPPSPETFKIFIHKTSESFVGGFHWSDLGLCIENAILFVGGFPSLSTQEKKQSVIDILDTIIDITDTPFLFNNVTDPIFKAMIPPLVNFVFDQL